MTVIRLDQLVRTWDTKTEGDVNLSEVSELSVGELLQLQSQVSLKQLDFFFFIYIRAGNGQKMYFLIWLDLCSVIFFLRCSIFFSLCVSFPKFWFFWSIGRLLLFFIIFTLIIYPTALLRIIKFRQNRSWRSNNSKLICCLCPPQRFADKEAIKFLHNNKASFFTAL